ncbi:MAG: CmpX protein [Candidatus Uhrbacteria bacterium GW2011_GWA2_52_8d]|uniref:CmpX protein n=1 Tax=Candidatus Uhrbacteria bacterium GW2011_GWA2_52_8d TaxID=1618979 RepID=A0A0G1ZW92_9BACT|nr:MAG: CmpX protein [Candidatus Uhrbacteria bacterium GW2011_GWA2_52_8d]
MYFAQEILQEPLLELWETIVAFLPSLLGAAIVFVIGVIIALVLRTVVVKVIGLLRIDELARHLEITAQFERVGLRLHIGALLGWIVKWFFIIIALIAATDILGWDQVTDYLGQVVLFVPNVIIAVIILLAGILLGNFVQNVVKSAVEAAQLASADFLSGIAKWAILIFTFMAALVQLQIAPELIRVLFTGLVAMLALAGGLAFGLGGQEFAHRFLNRLKKDISSER